MNQNNNIGLIIQILENEKKNIKEGTFWLHEDVGQGITT